MEFPQIPLGFRFCRTKYECIQYLICKVTSNPLPCNGLILDLDPYDVNQLPDIFSSVQKRGELYLFTKLHKKGRIGNVNVNRKVGKGTWHENQTAEVRDGRGAQVGAAYKFIYREKGSVYNRQFSMTEYTIVKGTELKYDHLKDYVLCHIFKSNGRQRGNRVDNSQSEIEVAALGQFESEVNRAPVENPSPSSVVFTYSSHSSPVETPISSFVENSFGTLSPAPHYDEDNFLEILTSVDNDIENPSLSSIRGNFFEHSGLNKQFSTANESVHSTSFVAHDYDLPVATNVESQSMYNHYPDCVLPQSQQFNVSPDMLVWLNDDISSVNESWKSYLYDEEMVFF